MYLSSESHGHQPDLVSTAVQLRLVDMSANTELESLTALGVEDHAMSAMLVDTLPHVVTQRSVKRFDYARQSVWRFSSATGSA